MGCNTLGAEIIFTFPGTNHVIQAEDILLKAGLHVQVMPLPPAIQAGCGLCLRLPPPENNNAEKLLRKHAISPQQIYKRIIKNGKSDFSILEGEDDGE